MKDQTEEIIKETAKKMFFAEGRFMATTQEIADEAGVNRTLINYYFRSRDNLLSIILEEAKMLDMERYKIILQNNEQDIRSMVSVFIDNTIENSLKYPYLETYIVSQMNNGSFFEQSDVSEIVTVLFQCLEEEMEKGNIEKVEPIQFLLNMISLVNFPLVNRPLIQQNLNISNQEYKRILSRRKEVILQTLFKK
ncbi:TetR/AcrR family transcriptional regulator [Vaginella massiliensis]|uniref:TetR/AcrR family transcriptional regulator n=1 Tax=Vaginella massiliensis TaxID=1816680 RepID=UPI000838CECE|nr:TetR/AcrR family transcriptional regulator [Vaginella massiliensis]